MKLYREKEIRPFTHKILLKAIRVVPSATQLRVILRFVLYRFLLQPEHSKGRLGTIYLPLVTSSKHCAESRV
jgi:hypothetical protein